jgi:polyisoprenoid-binding protein YceI
VIAVALVLLAASTFAAWRFMGGEQPPPVALQSASPPSAGTPSSAGTASGATPSADALDGDWRIDADSGSLADASSSFAGYRIREQFSGIGANTVVGRTQRVSGSLMIDGTTITSLSVDVDMTTLQSDNTQRDESLRERGLETDAFPTATFTLTKPIDVGTLPPVGEQLTVHAIGDLTLHGVTNEVDVPVQAVWTGRRIEAVGSVVVTLADYAIDPPVGFLVLSIADTGTVELHLLFRRG